MRSAAAVSILICSSIAGSETMRVLGMRILDGSHGGEDDAHDMQEEASVDNQNIGALLTKVANLVKGFVDLTPLKIELGDVTCVHNEGVISEIYGGRVLKYNSNLIDVECNTQRIHVSQPAHWWEDKPFVSDTLLELDNLGLRLQCNTDVFREYLKFMAPTILQKAGIGKKPEEEPVWAGPALCDIKKLEIADPKIYVESLDPTKLRRKKSNVERFIEKARETFGPKELEDVDPTTEDENPAAVDEAPATKEEGNPLITFSSIQDGSCMEHVYSKKGTYVDTQHEGLCGFLLLRLEVNIDGLRVVWTQAQTKLLAFFLSIMKKYTLANILYGFITHIATIFTNGVDSFNAIRRKLNVFSVFDRIFAKKDSK